MAWRRSSVRARLAPLRQGPAVARLGFAVVELPADCVLGRRLQVGRCSGAAARWWGSSGLLGRESCAESAVTVALLGLALALLLVLGCELGCLGDHGELGRVGPNVRERVKLAARI